MLFTLYFLINLFFEWVLPRSKTCSQQPPLVEEHDMLLNGRRFLTARWDFYKKWARVHKHFRFRLGHKDILAVSGHAARKSFLEDQEMSLVHGYTLLVGHESAWKVAGLSYEEGSLPRLRKVLRGENLKARLPFLISEMQDCIRCIAASGERCIDPFQALNGMVYRTATRMVGATEIVRDSKLGAQVKYHLQMIERPCTTMYIMFPWLPTLFAARRIWSGSRVYNIYTKIIQARIKSNAREDDSVQMFIDDGDDPMMIARVVMDSMIASAYNTATIVPWMLLYLCMNPAWMEKLRTEVLSVLDECVPDREAPMLDRFARLSLQDWETKFPANELAWKETIRIQSIGTLFRKNVTGHSIKLGELTVANNGFVVYHTNDAHHNSEIFADASRWDPSRFEGGIDASKVPYPFFGFGAATHPCAGARLARLQNLLIISMLLAVFEFQALDRNQLPLQQMPSPNMNSHKACPSSNKVLLRIVRRVGASN